MKTQKNALTFGGLLVAGLLTLTACGGDTSANAESEASGDMPTVTIAVTPSVNGLGVATADQEGIFEKHGVEVEIENILSGSEGAALLAGGDAQFAMFSMDNAINSVVEGHNNVMTVPLTQQGPERLDDPHGFGSIIVEAGGEIKEPKDLEGKAIGTSMLGGEAYLNAYQTLEAEGVDVESIEWVAIPGPQHVSSVLQGQVAAAVTAEPNLSIAMLDGSIEPAANVNGILPNAPSFGLASDKTWAEENAEVVTAIQDAVLEANALLNADREVADRNMREYMDIDDEVIDMVRLPTYPEELFTVEALEPVADRLIAFDQLAEANADAIEEVLFTAP